MPPGSPKSTARETEISISVSVCSIASHSPNTPIVNSAPATIAADPDARAEGVVYRVTEAQLDAMDAHEGVPEHYQRKHVVLRLTDGRRVESLTYMANPKHCAPGLMPPRFYLYHFFQASDLLSPGWMAWLRSVEKADV